MESTATIKTGPEISFNLNEMLSRFASLDTPELELIHQKLGSLVALRKVPSLSERENELLAAINVGIPATLYARYSKLMEKLRASKITPFEQEELSKLTDQIEWLDGERLEKLIELAQLRGISLDQLMQNPNFSFRNHAD